MPCIAFARRVYDAAINATYEGRPAKDEANKMVSLKKSAPQGSLRNEPGFPSKPRKSTNLLLNETLERCGRLSGSWLDRKMQLHNFLWLNCVYYEQFVSSMVEEVVLYALKKWSWLFLKDLNFFVQSDCQRISSFLAIGRK